MKIGLFGGSFDPVHYGHLLLAQQCLEAGGLDRVLFVPAAKSPHKPKPPIASDKARLEMLKLAIADHPSFQVSSCEIDRGGDSFTVDTLQGLKEKHTEDQFFLMMGADSLVDFPGWKLPEEILKLADLLVVDRPMDGQPGLRDAAWKALTPFAGDGQLDRMRDSRFQSDLFQFSSSAIRAKVAQSQSIRYRTPRGIELYIQTQKLYLTAAMK